MNLLETVGNGEVRPLRVFVLVALYDVEFREDGVALARTLRERGYDVGSLEIPEGHSWNAWKSHIDDVLEFLFPGEGRTS
jgi:enterochelin esterase-like enzyme